MPDQSSTNVFGRGPNGLDFLRDRIPTMSSLRSILGFTALLLAACLVGSPVFAIPTDADNIPSIEEPAPVSAPETRFEPREVRDLLEAQIVLSRMNISCGSIDGVYGLQTQAALKAFQQQQSLRVHGDLDAATTSALILDRPPMITITVSEEDLADLQPVPDTWVGKSETEHLGFASILEQVAERGHAHPGLIRKLNPDLDWDQIEAGARVIIPDTERAEVSDRAAMVLIHLAGKTLQVYDANGRLIMHFPCSIASRVEKRPVGQIAVEVLVTDPNYTFDPAVFPESAEARSLNQKRVIPPGPNNPVGVAWIGLDLPGYGIHGTPIPEQVGRTESHGCFRLANWNATTLSRACWIDMPVYVEP